MDLKEQAIEAMIRSPRLHKALIDLGYALLTGIISIALSNSASNKLNQLKKYKKEKLSKSCVKSNEKTN